MEEQNLINNQYCLKKIEKIGQFMEEMNFEDDRSIQVFLSEVINTGNKNKTKNTRDIEEFTERERSFRQSEIYHELQ